MWPFRKKRARRVATVATGLWSVGRGDHDGAPLYVRVRQDLQPVLGGGAQSHRVGFAVPLRAPTEDGLPQGPEFEELSRIEDLLASALESGGKSTFVLSITTGGMREFVFYTSDPDGVRAAIPGLRGQVHGHQLQSHVEHDPEWKVYQHFSAFFPQQRAGAGDAGAGSSS